VDDFMFYTGNMEICVKLRLKVDTKLATIPQMLGRDWLRRYLDQEGM
jgi:hypothetical protein